MLPPAIFHGETIDEYFPLNGQQGQGKEGMVHLALSFAPIETGQAGPVPAPVPEPLPIREEDINGLKEMFPNVDGDVIHAILQDCRGEFNLFWEVRRRVLGNKDAAVNALLQLA